MNEHQLFIARMRHFLKRSQTVNAQAFANLRHTTVTDPQILEIHNALRADPIKFIETCDNSLLEEITRYMKVLEREYPTNEENDEKV